MGVERRFYEPGVDRRAFLKDRRMCGTVAYLVDRVLLLEKLRKIEALHAGTRVDGKAAAALFAKVDPDATRCCRTYCRLRSGAFRARP